MGTRRRNDVYATSLRRIDVVTTSCACWEFGPPLAPQNSKPWPPQYSKPSYAYAFQKYNNAARLIGFPTYSYMYVQHIQYKISALQKICQWNYSVGTELRVISNEVKGFR